MAALVEGEVVVGGPGVQTTRRTTREVERLPVMTAQVEAIAGPFWADLVDPADYLEPRCGWLLREPSGEHVTAGELVVSLNPELHAIGDFVTRCLSRRVEVLVEVLEGAGSAVLSSARSLGRAAPKCVSEIADDAARLREVVRQLHAVCRSDPEAAARDSCAVLTRVYAAFHPAPDVGWLGLDGAVVEAGRVALRHRFANPRNRELPERVAAALDDLRRLYANEPPGRAALDEAVAGGGLVVVASQCTAYWQCNRLDVDWDKHERPWEVLVELARKGRRGTAVEERDLFSKAAPPSAVATLFGRLKRLLPADLREYIVPGNNPRSYHLTLDPSQITVIDQPA